MGSLIRGFDLGDAILQHLIVRSRLGELIVDAQRELPVALLEIELRHGLVDERLRTWANEETIFLS
jgi:hypothetical protein